MKKSTSVLIILVTASNVFSADLNDYSVGCKVFGNDINSTQFSAINKNVVFETGRTFKLRDKKTIAVNFKKTTGETVPFNLSIEKLELGPNQFNSSNTVGAKYSFNNPFDINTGFFRNDKTAETTLTGSGFSHENAVNGQLADTMDYMKSRPNQSTITPYMMVGISDPQNKGGNKGLHLIAPNGHVISSLLVVCTSAHKFE